MSKYDGRTAERDDDGSDRNTLVHATCVEQSDSYHYDEKTACGRYTDNGYRFWPASKDAKVTCLPCLAVLDG